MKKEKYTPGPWRIGYAYTGQPRRTIVNDAGTIAVSKVFASHIPEQAEANARLIAAAPELLERLTDIISFVKKDLKERNIPFCFTGAEDAIKKALGE